MTGHLAKAYDWDLNYRANPKNPKLKMVGKDVDEGVVYAGPLTVGKEMMQVRVADTVEIVGSNSTGQRRTGTNP